MQPGTSGLEQLPLDAILQHLRMKDVAALSASCRGLRDALRVDALWRAAAIDDPAYPRHAPEHAPKLLLSMLLSMLLSCSLAALPA